MAQAPEDANSEEEYTGPINLDLANGSQEDDADVVPRQNKSPDSIGAEIRDCLDIPFVATNQTDEMLVTKFKAMYKKIVDAIKDGLGMLSYLQKEPPCIVYKPKKGKQIRTSDDIIDAIILTIVERESSNHRRLKQAIAQSEQLK